jgi:hypothetical protein
MVTHPVLIRAISGTIPREGEAVIIAPGKIPATSRASSTACCSTRSGRCISRNRCSCGGSSGLRAKSRSLRPEHRVLVPGCGSTVGECIEIAHVVDRAGLQPLPHRIPVRIEAERLEPDRPSREITGSTRRDRHARGCCGTRALPAPADSITHGRPASRPISSNAACTSASPLRAHPWPQPGFRA